MTREEAIRDLTKLIQYGGLVGVQCHEALNMAIKSLEQEPVLDKLRAELHATAEMHRDGNYYLRDEWIDEYFNMYRTESEVHDVDNRS